MEVLDGRPTLNDLNTHLIERLDEVIRSTTNAEALLSLTEAVAKLNASSRNNNQLERPETDEERQAKEVANLFGDELGEAAVIQGE